MGSTHLAVTLTSLLLVASTASQTSPDPSKPLASLNQHNEGFFALGADGVLRSLAPNQTVVDHVKLSNAGEYPYVSGQMTL